MGRIAVDLLLKVIDGDRPASVSLPSELIVRESSLHRLSDPVKTQRKN
jgi:LacI family transcriptional regulator